MNQITVTYHHDDMTWWAEADDAPGFSALADSLPELRAAVREGLRAHLNVERLTIVEKNSWLAAPQKTVVGEGSLGSKPVYHLVLQHLFKGSGPARGRDARALTNPRVVIG